MILAVAVVVYAQQFRKDPHGREGQCQSCHYGPKPEGVEPPAPGQVRGGRLQYALRFPSERAVCERCHNAPKEQSHPIGMTPRMPIPKGWPLDSEGRLMCSTCHDPHQAVRPGSKRGSSPLLRTKRTGPQFCASCHSGLSRSDLRSWHILAAESAHGNKPKSRPSARGRRIDPLSLRCLSCHDGTVGPDASFRVGRRKSVDLSKSHPIGVRYPVSGVGHRGQSRYKSISLLDKRIRLFDGKVGCGSCHNPYSRGKLFLVIDNNRSRLCRACHKI